ncbi:unnamed protein product [Cylindrotheca closterium]|uniref:Uncharacterized protein n=1 Tax=Cylindrotheca closterium TaxID=2856 RepID=A0AAD2PUG0_9STRA|nr:unnamed protein product [Cylindrotheca closterium]
MRKKKIARLSELSDDSSDTSDEILITKDLEEMPATTTYSSLTVCAITDKKETIDTKLDEPKGDSSDNRAVVHSVSSEANIMDNSEEYYSLSMLKERIHHNYSNPSPSMLQAKIQTPLVFSAAIQTLLVDAQSQIKFRQGTNQIDPNMGDVDKTKKADPIFLQLEGRTVHNVRWELNIPGILLKCPICNSGELIHQEYDFCEDATTTALWSPSGDIDFACSMNYKCNGCHEQCKANDGRLLASPGAHFCNAYPVDPLCALSDEPIHLNQSLLRLMDILLAKMTENNESNVVQTFAEVLQQLQRKRHAELRSQYLDQASFVEENLAAEAPGQSLGFPNMDEWRGPFNVPTGNMLEILADAVAEAKLAKSISAASAMQKMIVRSPKTYPVATTPAKIAIEIIQVANACVDNHDDDVPNLSLTQAGHSLNTEIDSAIEANEMLDKG